MKQIRNPKCFYSISRVRSWKEELKSLYCKIYSEKAKMSRFYYFQKMEHFNLFIFAFLYTLSLARLSEGLEDLFEN